VLEAATGFPGSNGRIPMENAFLAEVLRQRGWNTFWLGKNHNAPSDEWDMGASKANWPLARTGPSRSGRGDARGVAPATGGLRD